MKKGVIVLIYVIGLLGIVLAPNWFVPMSVFSLLFTFVWMGIGEWTKRDYLLAVIIALLGWGVEYVGVHYHVPFGIYSYGTGLGFSIREIPLVIGLNWVIVTIGSWSVVQWAFPQWRSNAKVVMSAILMTVLDVMIEPVAPHLDYWMFQLNWPPIENYLSWFWIGLFFSWLVSKWSLKLNTSLAMLIWFCQFFFFVILQMVF